MISRIIFPIKFRHAARRFAWTEASELFEEKASLLAGHWKGKGEVVSRNTPAPFWEEVEFKIISSSADTIVYRMQAYSEHALRGVPMHTENGFIKIINVPGEEGETIKVEAGFTHPFASSVINEISHGTVKDDELVLEATDFQRATPAEKGITGFHRVYRREDDRLLYDHFLSFDNSELYHHLHGELELQETGLFK